MAIETFLNPIEEAVKDTDEELEQAIIDELAVQPNHESDEEIEVIPPIPVFNALQSLQVLHHFVEQQEQGYSDLIPHLNELERRLAQQRRRGRQQAAVTTFFS